MTEQSRAALDAALATCERPKRPFGIPDRKHTSRDNIRNAIPFHVIPINDVLALDA